ncbi:MAG: flagellar motor switch protein FliN [Leptospiraceae bacterium]|nr:flagellar motor switch protein FliN [Leptospiraceae bacterium]
MGDGSLSQDEIDALLQGADDTPSYDTGSSGAGMGGGGDELSPLDRDALTEILTAAFSTAGGMLGTVLSKNVRFVNPTPETKSAADLSAEIGAGSVCLFTTLSGPVNGRACLVMSMENGSKIAHLLLGGLSTGAMEAAQLDTLKQGFTSVMGNVTVQIGVKVSAPINGSPLDVSSSKSPRDLILPDGKTLVRTTVNLNIDGIGVFKCHYIISKSMADEILALSRRTPNRTGYGDSSGGMSVNVSPSNFGGPSGGLGMTSSGPQIGIKGVSFPSLSTAGAPSGVTNLNLLMDVQMSLTVELGRTKMYIKDILGLGEGSIIELDKLAGEPVDLLVNGKLIAKGEVVVIDENFGVRVTDIVSPTDRIKSESK